MNVGFIGLGNLGRAMAERLISQGVRLVVWNRTISKADGLEAEIARSPADVINRSDAVFLNLFDSPAVAAVIEGDEGLLMGDCSGKVIVDTTTNHFDAVGAFYDLMGKVGATYLEAPIFGSVAPALKGALTIVISGDREGYNRVYHLLELLGQNLFFLGRPTLATRMKLVNNMVLGSFMTTLAEAAAFGEAAGIDREKVLDILSVGGGNSGVLKAKRQKMIDGDYAAHFSVEAIYKDLRYAQDLASEVRLPMLMAGTAREIFALARAAGMGADDFSAVHKVLCGMPSSISREESGD